MTQYEEFREALILYSTLNIALEKLTQTQMHKYIKQGTRNKINNLEKDLEVTIKKQVEKFYLVDEDIFQAIQVSTEHYSSLTVEDIINKYYPNPIEDGK